MPMQFRRRFDFNQGNKQLSRNDLYDDTDVRAIIAGIGGGTPGAPGAAGKDGLTPRILFSEDFARCTVGQAPTKANTNYTNNIGDSGDEAGSVVATTIVDDLLGGKAVNFNNPTIKTTTYGFLGKVVAPGADGKLVLERFYRVDVRPLFRTSICLYKDTLLGGTHVGSFALGGATSAYKFVFVDIDTNSTVSSADFPVQEWFRVVLTLDTVAHTQTADLYLGANIFGTNPTETMVAGIGTTPVGYIEDGIMTNPNMVINLRMTRPRNMNMPWPAPVPGPKGDKGVQGTPGVVVLAAGDPDPSSPISGVLYVRKTP